MQIIEKQKHDLNDANFHINILATALGSIPNRCHFYPIIFDLGEPLNAKKMIGSTLNHEFYDCGYKLGVTGDLQKYPAIMNDNMRYRYLLNSFVWTPVTLHSLLFPATYVDDCKAVYHFMNYVRDENYNNRSDFEKYQSYSNTRAVTFLRLFEENETGIQLKQNGKIFAVNTLNIYVQDQWKDNLDGALIDIFQEIAQATAYEQYLLRVFTQIEREYNEIKKIYQPPTAENSPIIKHIISVQDAQSKICVNPLPTIQQYKNFRTNLQLAAFEAKKDNNDDDDDDDDDENKPFIDILTNHSDALDSLELFPFFIRCYQIFSNALWKKIRRNDFNKPFLEVIHNLFLKKRITQKSYENICKLYEDFTVKFNQLAKTLDSINYECEEIQIPKIERDTFISTILSIREASVDGIINILKALYNHQDKVLLAIDDYSYINQSLTSDGLYFDKTNTANSAELQPLAYQQSSKLSIINCSNQNISQWIDQVCLSHRFINKATQKITFKDDKNKNIITMINHDAITFDFERIEQECIQFVSGTSFLKVGEFREPIQTIEDITEAAQIKDEITASIIHDNSNTSDQEFAQLELLDDPVAKLYWIVNKNEKLKEKKHIIKDISCELESKTRKKLLLPNTKKYTENDVISLCKSLTELIIIIVSQNKTNERIRKAKTKKLNQAFKILNVQYPDHVRTTLCNVPCNSLIPFCKFMLQEIYYKKQWLFQKENMTSEFLPDQSKFYSELNNEFESKDIQFSNDKLPIIEDILQKLTAKKSNQWLINIESQPQSNLLEVLTNNNNCTDLRNKYSHYKKIIHLIVCPSLNVGQLQLFRQWLYALCGNINVRNQIENPYKQEKNKLSNSLEDDSFSEYYKEKLPIKIDGRTQQNNHLHVSDVGDIPFSSDVDLQMNDKDNDNHDIYGDDDDDEMENFRFSDTPDLSPYPEIDVDGEIEQQFTPINGISNEKNNCWLSSILQCYSNNKLMIDKCKFLVERIEKENSFVIQFYNILTNLQNDIDGKSNTIRIIDLYTDIIFSYNKSIEDQGKQNEISPLEVSKYQDVREFQYSIFPAVLKSKLKQASFVLFSRFCLYRSITIYHCCKTTKTEQINTLSMLVEKPCSLEDLLQNFSSGKCSDECRNCKMYEIVHQKIKIETNTLMEFTIPISFERTAENIPIDLPLNYPIDVSYLFYIDSEEHDIEVQGIINSAVHYVDYSEYPIEKKKDIQVYQKLTGHYFASICKTTGDDREWFRADDSYVKAIDSKEINTSEIVLAYLTIKPTLCKKPLPSPLVMNRHSNNQQNISREQNPLPTPNTPEVRGERISDPRPYHSEKPSSHPNRMEPGSSSAVPIQYQNSNSPSRNVEPSPPSSPQVQQQGPFRVNSPASPLGSYSSQENISAGNHVPGTFAAPNQQMNYPANVNPQGVGSFGNNTPPQQRQNPFNPSASVVQPGGYVGNNPRPFTGSNSTILPPTSNNVWQTQQPNAPQQPNQWQMNQNQNQQANQFYQPQNNPQQYQNQQYQNMQQQQRQQLNQQQNNQWSQMNQQQNNQNQQQFNQQYNQNQRNLQQYPNQQNNQNQNQRNPQQYPNQQYQNQQNNPNAQQQFNQQYNQMNPQFQAQFRNQQFNPQQYPNQQYQNQQQYQYQQQQQRQQLNQQPNQWSQMNQNQYQQRGPNSPQINQNNQPNQNYGRQNK